MTTLRISRSANLVLIYLVSFFSASAFGQQRDSESELGWVTAEIKAPRVAFHTFDSEAAKTKVSYHLYTPAAYSQETQRRFPVVYWLHGSGGGLAGIARVAAHFDAAIEVLRYLIF